MAEALRQSGVAENLARLTGLAVERRAEGVLLADASGKFTDRPFPGRGGAVNRAAGLLLAKIADALEQLPRRAARPASRPRPVAAALPIPPATTDQRDLLARIDAALPMAGVVSELAWTAPDPPSTTEPSTTEPSTTEPGTTGHPHASAADARATRPLHRRDRLRAMIGELYDELGAASFTITWQHDPSGLLNAAVTFLADLRLLRPVDGGVLVLPAAARYRNIKLALPVRHAEGQLALDLFGGPGFGELSFGGPGFGGPGDD